jgi:hypothetical protein
MAETPPEKPTVISPYIFSEYSSITSVSSGTLDMEEGFSSLNPNNIPPEKLMFMAVVYQAVLDATRKPFVGESEDSKAYRQEALDWFFDPEEFDDLEDVCSMAGVQSSVLCTTVERILNGEIPFDRKRINVLINNFDFVEEEDNGI